MRWLQAVAEFAVLLAILLVGGPSLAQDKRPPTPSVAPDPEVCAEVRATARFVGYGYTHVVTLKNKCPKPVECQLWTDVDPEPRTTVQVAPGGSAEVVTRRGSPARAVSGLKNCRFR
jgi:hypothetical protein